MTLKPFWVLEVTQNFVNYMNSYDKKIRDKRIFIKEDGYIPSGMRRQISFFWKKSNQNKIRYKNRKEKK